MSRVVARVDRDYINGKEPDDTVPARVGTVWTEAEVRLYLMSDFIGGQIIDKLPDEQTRYRMKDDDGEVYYGGWLLDDDESVVQQMVLNWGTYDAGCTTIEVKRGEEWVQDIG